MAGPHLVCHLFSTTCYAVNLPSTPNRAGEEDYEVQLICRPSEKQSHIRWNTGYTASSHLDGSNHVANIQQAYSSVHTMRELSHHQEYPHTIIFTITQAYVLWFQSWWQCKRRIQSSVWDIKGVSPFSYCSKTTVTLLAFCHLTTSSFDIF